jgi:hypothetical protein
MSMTTLMSISLRLLLLVRINGGFGIGGCPSLPSSACPSVEPPGMMGDPGRSQRLVSTYNHNRGAVPRAEGAAT